MSWGDFDYIGGNDSDKVLRTVWKPVKGFPESVPVHEYKWNVKDKTAYKFVPSY